MVTPVTDSAAVARYWLEFSTYDDPAPKLLRRTVDGSGGRTDEIWDVFRSQWRPTEVLARAESKGSDGMPEELTEAQAVKAAAELERRWRRRYASQGKPWPTDVASE